LLGAGGAAHITLELAELLQKTVVQGLASEKVLEEQLVDGGPGVLLELFG
jgi:hypothetical protein